MRKKKRKKFDFTVLSGRVASDHLEAEMRVKGKRYARTNMARWLLDFAFRNLSSLSPKGWHDLQWDGLIFAFSPGPDHVLPMLGGNIVRPLPTKNELMRIQHWLLSLWAELKQNGRVSIAPQHGLLILVVYGDKLGGYIASSSVGWSDAFKLQVYETLTADDVVRRFRFCHKCRHPFWCQKRQAYCSLSCSQSHRTRLWREKNRERFRAARRAAYKRKLEKRLGHPVKIASHSKKGTSK